MSVLFWLITISVLLGVCTAIMLLLIARAPLIEDWDEDPESMKGLVVDEDHVCEQVFRKDAAGSKRKRQSHSGQRGQTSSTKGRVVFAPQLNSNTPTGGNLQLPR